MIEGLKSSLSQAEENGQEDVWTIPDQDNQEPGQIPVAYPAPQKMKKRERKRSRKGRNRVNPERMLRAQTQERGKGYISKCTSLLEKVAECWGRKESEDREQVNSTIKVQADKDGLKDKATCMPTCDAVAWDKMQKHPITMARATQGAWFAGR
ncbi:hypothetical protein NDU88_005613 [Pleurodeles waltl]|uniref:Uncharacterized protein n=1 Tax=Pleurodeles waltl TaxID=8319 RepID=A0AAV7RNS7_PLEWA|nr:hypothetical protein NDU88_005613 [Pleurodeles waltl]